MVNLDTHMVVALLRGELSGLERNHLLENEWLISDVVLWELAHFVRLGRLEMDFEDEGFKRVLDAMTVAPVTLEIARASTKLDFRSDPVDEIIAATSIVRKIPLLTRAHVIRRSRMTPLVELR